jgi:Heavy metal binding domain
MRPIAALLFAVALVSAIAAAPQTARPAPQQGANLPPLSWTCPMHPDVLEDKKGTCPICKMDLVPVRLDAVWSCPVHSVIAESRPGKCPIDKRDLIQVTVAVSWTCPGATAESTEPGQCPDGSPMTRRTTPRAHGNHNPQHGGQFFMASDNWHHLEGTYLPTGVFRMHLYDDYTKPLPAKDVRKITASVVTKDASGKETITPLVRSGQYLQARIGKLPLPAAIYAKVKFKADGPDNRFDFTFDSYSKEPVAGATPMSTAAAPAATMPPAATAPAATAPSPAAPALTETLPNVDPALVPLPVPETVPEMLAQLRLRTEQIRSFIDNGSFAAIYVPAFQAKDLALALDDHVRALPAERRKIVEPAITKLVRSAWLLDAFGDIGNKQQISEAYDRFVEAANDIHTSFPQQP